ncbi:MAG TPA: (deoxy)nucleoside triphosphate pyrophosphohydrolase [Treponemataceae bacterium]|jgi:8-oxo-dGTP diphosphatase|nr:MAG: (deoxy)nucleoside triphosphate pyrophosphohydrolase [Treponema sp.]HOC30147.1 (deoxy)nucleoside triphosphate pyrophosphohydrolase [Treponemataceae bacterium]HPX47036.1 (deoxy)nucleoside triphosphate pyrophosphohydrolase [Treponemataceae bacterium]HQL33705.1 (deoxy)nucleoside triphosphate pyrophosphohydrolase [Treponemataceae bacterium]
MKESVAGIVYHNNRFLVGLRLPGGEMGSRWEFPGGKVDGGESPAQALIREFHEEMGIAVTIHEHIATTEFVNKNGPSLLHAYHVELDQTDAVTLTEHVKTAWLSFDELQKLPFVDSDTLLFPYIESWMPS